MKVFIRISSKEVSGQRIQRDHHIVAFYNPYWKCQALSIYYKLKIFVPKAYESGVAIELDGDMVLLLSI